MYNRSFLKKHISIQCIIAVILFTLLIGCEPSLSDEDLEWRTHIWEQPDNQIFFNLHRLDWKLIRAYTEPGVKHQGTEVQPRKMVEWGCRVYVTVLNHWKEGMYANIQVIMKDKDGFALDTIRTYSGTWVPKQDTVVIQHTGHMKFSNAERAAYCTVEILLKD